MQRPPEPPPVPSLPPQPQRAAPYPRPRSAHASPYRTCLIWNTGNEQVHKAVEGKGIVTLSAEVTSIALQTTAVDDSGAATVTRLVEALEENDDVGDVFTNADFPEDA